MIDAEAMDVTLCEKLGDETMGGFKNVGIFHADACEVCDIEEPSVIELLEAGAPEGESVTLLVEEIVEGGEGGGVTRLTVELAAERSG
jgi:hypothetical protein